MTVQELIKALQNLPSESLNRPVCVSVASNDPKRYLLFGILSGRFLESGGAVFRMRGRGHRSGSSRSDE